MRDIKVEDKKVACRTPTACQYKNLISHDKQRACSENVDWLSERSDPFPLWSRLRSKSVAAQAKNDMSSGRNNYRVDTPELILSVFGSAHHQTSYLKKMENMKNYPLLSCILALCAAFKKGSNNLSENLIDTITTVAAHQYTHLLKELSITDKQLNVSDLSKSYSFKGDEFNVKLQHVATGQLYNPVGSNGLNLARALTFFFGRYKYGLIQCSKRTLAFGHSSDTDYSYFMYDCQSRGYPMFADQEANSYILRAPSLQLLLYCLIVTFNVTTKMMPFFIYKTDIAWLKPSGARAVEKKMLTKKKLPERPNSSSSNKASVLNNSTNKTSSKMKRSKISLMSKQHTTVRGVASRAMKNPDMLSTILMDPNKMYYVIAVPRQWNTIPANFSPQQLLYSPQSKTFQTFQNIQNPSAEKIENVTVNIRRVNSIKAPETNDDLVEESYMETFRLTQSASVTTLTPNTADMSSTKIPELYVVANSNELDSKKPVFDKKIKIARQLRDLFSMDAGNIKQD